MNYKEFTEIVENLEEKEDGKLYDSKGRFRAYFNPKEFSLILTTRYFYCGTGYTHVCGMGGWYPSGYEVFDRETKKTLRVYHEESECIAFLIRNYPKYEDPLAYWSE